MDNEDIFSCKILCRLCLAEGSNNFTCVFDMIEENVRLSDIVMIISSIEISEDDGMSEKICNQCVEEINRIQRFKLLCQKSNEILRLKLNDVKNEYYEEKPKLSIIERALINANITETEEILFRNETNKENFTNSIKSDSSDEDEPLSLRLERLQKDNFIENIVDDDRKGVFHTNKKENEFKCNMCDKNFSYEKVLINHQKTHENDDEKPYKCYECGKSFVGATHLKIHRRSHISNEQKEHICEICNKKYAYPYQLTQHKYKHTVEKPFPCSHCNKGCLTAESLRRHMKTHEIGYKKPKHVCEICKKEFPYPSFLAEHMKNHTGEKPFLCSFCGKGFRQSGALEYHIRIHTGLKPFECSVCQTTFMSQSVLKVHMRRHTNERPYICDVCGRGFRQSTDMRSHRRTHTGDKPVECSVCRKRMRTTGQLTIHMRTHTGEKPHSCQYCEKAFTTRTMMKKHERVHTGEKPYVCTVCGRAFSQSSSLNTHMKTHNRKAPLSKQYQLYTVVPMTTASLISIVQ